MIMMSVLIFLNILTTVILLSNLYQQNQQLDRMMSIIKRYQQMNREYREMIEILLPKEELNGN